jgi:hypothetical protein
MEADSVLCDVRTESSYVMQVIWSPQSVHGEEIMQIY